MEFNCNKCGECCRNLAATIEYIKDGNIPMNLPGVDLKRLVEEFPYKTNPEGACEMLVDGVCSVYSERPDLCNYRRIYERYPEGAANLKQWYLKMMDNCNFAIRLSELSDEHLITEPWH